MVKRRWTRKI